jgi:membrane protein
MSPLQPFSTPGRLPSSTAHPYHRRRIFRVANRYRQSGELIRPVTQERGIQPDGSADPQGRKASLLTQRSPRSLWNLQGLSLWAVGRRIWTSILADRLLGRAAELGFYFLFALFPTLFSASSILGLAAKSGPEIYDKLLNYLALVIPTSALGTVLVTFNQTTAASTSGKVTFGLIASIWSASVGISAIQDALNSVYRVKESRSFLRGRMEAIGLTLLLTVLVTLTLAAMLGGDFTASLAGDSIPSPALASVVQILCRVVGWLIATALLILSFAVIYYWAPDVKARRWLWLSPGGCFGILGWLLASLGLRVYLHFYNSYAVTYGSLGAVIILLTWFYITGLMILVGAEINSEIEAGAAAVAPTKS